MKNLLPPHGLLTASSWIYNCLLVEDFTVSLWRACCILVESSMYSSFLMEDLLQRFLSFMDFCNVFFIFWIVATFWSSSGLMQRFCHLLDCCDIFLYSCFALLQPSWVDFFSTSIFLGGVTVGLLFLVFANIMIGLPC